MRQLGDGLRLAEAAAGGDRRLHDVDAARFDQPLEIVHRDIDSLPQIGIGERARSSA